MIWVLRPLRQADPRPSPQIWTHPQIDSIDVSEDFELIFFFILQKRLGQPKFSQKLIFFKILAF